MFVARGRAEVDRRQAQVQQRTTTAKSIGQVAVTFGVPMVRKCAPNAKSATARQRAQSFLEVIGGATIHRRGSTGRGRRPSAAARPPPRPLRRPSCAKRAEARDPAPVAALRPGGRPVLPIPGYDALSASQVVERLAGLTPEELESVRSYESAHRNRRTILGKIDQISS